MLGLLRSLAATAALKVVVRVREVLQFTDKVLGEARQVLVDEALNEDLLSELGDDPVRHSSDDDQDVRVAQPVTLSEEALRMRAEGATPDPTPPPKPPKPPLRGSAAERARRGR